MEIVITGAGLISPLGDDAGALHDALLDGRSGLAPITLFPTDGLSGTLAGEIARFDANAYLGNTNLRPLDRPARLAAAAAGRALADAGWFAPPDDPPDDAPDYANNETDAEARRTGDRTGLVLGTMFGSLRTIAEFDRRAMSAGPSYASPLDFANSVINAAAGQAAIWHELPGVNATIAGGPTAGVVALGFAADQIRSGRADRLLAGGVEELCFEALLGFGRLGLLSASGNPRPFDRHRDGLALGEGAAFLALEIRGLGGGARRPPAGIGARPRRGLRPEPGRRSGERQRRVGPRDPRRARGVRPRSGGGGRRQRLGQRAAGRPPRSRGAACRFRRPSGRDADRGRQGRSWANRSAPPAPSRCWRSSPASPPGGCRESPVSATSSLGSGLAASHAGNRDLRLRIGLVTARGFDGQAAALVISAPAAPAAASGVLPSEVHPMLPMLPMLPNAEKAA